MLKDLKILFLTWEVAPMMEGGLGVLARHAINELRNQGCQVTVLVPQIPGHLDIPDVVNLQKETRRFYKENLPIKNLDFRLDTFFQGRKQTSGWPRLFSGQGNKKPKSKTLYPNHTPALTRAWGFAIREFLRKNPDYDLVIGCDWETIPAFRLLKQDVEIPFYFYVNATEYDRSPDKLSHNAKMIFDLEKAAYKEADGIIAISNVSRDILQNIYQVPPEKMVVVFNDLDFKPQYKGFKSLNKGKNVLFIGRVEAQKGLKFLIETASRVVEVDSQVRFIFAGDGDLLPYTIQEVCDRELERNCFFTGWVDDQDKKQLYRSSDLFVMPSPREPFGLTPFEAIRSGVPVISSDSCGFLGVVPTTPTFKYYDIQAFAQLILYYLGSPEASQKLIQTQQAELKKHSWKKEIQKLIQFLQVKSS